MLEPGVYPASVTPFTEKGRIDPNGVAKLLAHFESTGCKGVVLAGTNGEGPSLSAVEKRDLIQIAKGLNGNLKLILGAATPSLDEAIWLSKRASEFGAEAVLLMPPYYFKSATDDAIVEWYCKVLDNSPVPVLAYNYPKATGVILRPKMMQRIGAHANCAGCKDSSGDSSNLKEFRDALVREDQVLFVGDETLLLQALEAGWTGTISGAANVVSRFLSAIVEDWNAKDLVSCREKFKLVLPALQLIRAQKQPASNKCCLHSLGIVERNLVRLPLESEPSTTADLVLAEVRKLIGNPV